MVAFVVVSTFVVLVLGVLVAGLLRSHADILRSLHELGPVVLGVVVAVEVATAVLLASLVSPWAALVVVALAAAAVVTTAPRSRRALRL